MKDRLQFRHHNQVFDTREAAIEYIKSQIRFTDEGLASKDPSHGKSLFAEPTVLLYKNEDDVDLENGVYPHPHLILVIGSMTNEDTQYSNNRFCIIDIDKTEDEIADLQEELEKAIKSLSIITLNTDTLNLYSEKTEDGTYISGDVKVAASYVFDDVTKKNNLMVGEDGIFIYVNLTYDEENETFTFTVSKADGTLEETSVKLPNNYVTGGVYDKKSESIILSFRESDEKVVIDCEELIAEWDVEGEGSKTPVVLTKETVGYGDETSHQHVEPWQDVLMADVRLKDETKTVLEDGTFKYTKDENTTNILDRTSDGRYLYVDGKASNIIYYKNGQKSNVKETLDELCKIKLSTDNDNIIVNRTDGFFASTKLNYVSKENKLVFKVSGQEDTIINLNSFQLFENIYYDSTTEELVITYIDGNDKIQIVRIPIGEMITDWEWEVQNEGHDVKLVKTRVKNGNDKLSADVKIHNGDNNILADKDHTLYVRGEADNIKYGDNSNVEKEIDDLKAMDTTLNEKIENEISRSVAADEELNNKVDAVSADTATRLKAVINNDHSIDIDNSDAVKPVIKVNLSSEIEDDKENIIKLNNDGLYAGVDLQYSFDGETGANQLIFKTTNTTKTIDLQTNSQIDKIYYDPSREAIIVEYTVNGHRMPDVVIPLGDLVNEWRIWDGHEGAVQLEKERIPSGSTEKDVLKASVVISDSHDDNILVNDGGALYVSGFQIVENKEEIVSLKTRMDNAETNINDEKTRAISAETALNNSIESEKTRATTAEQNLSHAIDDEVSARSEAISARIAKDTEIENDLNNETARSIAKDAELETKITNEATTARAAESALRENLTTEVSNRTVADSNLQTQITNEVERAIGAESALTIMIANEKEARVNEDAQIWEKIRPIEFKDTTTIHNERVRNSGENPDEVRHSIILSSSDKNILKATDNLGGVYATATLEYDELTNTITLKGTDGIVLSSNKLGAGSLLDSIEYDSQEKNMIIKYHNASGEAQELVFGVSELFNEWEIQNPSEGSALELHKITNTGETGNVDVLWGRVLIAGAVERPDGSIDYGDNIIRIVNNGIYASGSAITKAIDTALCVQNEMKVFETAVFQHTIDNECGSGYTYTPKERASYISSAKSMFDADVILDEELKKANDKIEEMSGSSVELQAEVDRIEEGAGLTVDGNYVPEITAKFISGATSLKDADNKLNMALDNLQEAFDHLMIGSDTPSTHIWVEQIGENKHMNVDVRLSHGNSNEMTDEELTLTSLDGTNTFTETNVLKIVDVTGLGYRKDVPYNGIYLSNIWDCGDFSGEGETIEYNYNNDNRLS